MLTYQQAHKPFKIGHMYFVYHWETGFLMQNQYDGIDENGRDLWTFSHKLSFMDSLSGYSLEEVGNWLKEKHGPYHVYQLVSINLDAEIKKRINDILKKDKIDNDDNIDNFEL